MVLGDNRPFITAIVVPEKTAWRKLCEKLGLKPDDPAALSARPVRQAVLRVIKTATKSFPNYGIPRDVVITLTPWTIDNGMLTPTLKIKRRVILERLKKEIDELYGSRN